MDTKFLVEYSPLVLKRDVPKLSQTDLERLKKVVTQKLFFQPYLFGKPLRNVLKNHYSLRVGDMRVVYEIIDKKVLVYVIAIGKRATIYETVKNRIF